MAVQFLSPWSGSRTSVGRWVSSIVFFSGICLWTFASLNGVEYWKNRPSLPGAVSWANALESSPMQLDNAKASSDLESTPDGGNAPQARTEKYLWFREFKSVGGHWSGRSANVQVLSDTGDAAVGSAAFRLLGAKNWGNHLSVDSRQDETARPELAVTVLVPQNLVHHWVRVHAELDVLYPHALPHEFLSNDALRFSDETEVFVTDERFFVVTPSEYRALDSIERRWWIAFVFAAFGSVMVGVSFLK